MSKYWARRSAVSAVTPRCPLRIAVIQFVGTSRALVSALADSPSSSSSSAKISPGWTGLIPLLVVISQFSDSPRSPRRRAHHRPTKTNSPLSVDSYAVLPRSVAGQWLQTRTPEEMLGRVMSLLTVSAISLSPISCAASDVLLRPGAFRLEPALPKGAERHIAL